MDKLNLARWYKYCLNPDGSDVKEDLSVIAGFYKGEYKTHGLLIFVKDKG